MKIKIITILITLITVTFVNAQTNKYENLNSAVNTLSSFYNAINGKDYQRAYGYWQNPDQDYKSFVRGYEKTENVRLIVEPPASIEGAAGSLYAQIPTVLIASQKDGTQTTYSGCYTLRKSNLHPPDIPKEDVWHIYKGNIKTASPEMEIPKLLAESCAETTNPPTDEKAARVPGVIGFDSENLSDSIEVPETIRANKVFQVTVKTSGNGCFSSGETSVVSGDMSADIFVYDFTTATRPGVACTLILKQFSHNAAVKFAKTGEAIIRVWGRKQGGNSSYGEPVVVEKRVTVK